MGAAEGKAPGAPKGSIPPAASTTGTPAVDHRKVGQATMRVNRETPIDFGNSAAGDAFVDTDGRESPYITKLAQLLAGVKGGQGKVGDFYRIGTYTAASGARTTIRNLKRQTDRFPEGATFDLKVKMTYVDGNRRSELWGAVATIDDVDPEG